MITPLLRWKFIKISILAFIGCSFISSVIYAHAANWSPILVLDNGDEILWKLNPVVKPNQRLLVEELRELSNVRDGIKSFITHFEVDCNKHRIRELSYEYYAKENGVAIIKTTNIKSGSQRWSYADWNEYVKLITVYFCF
jgi:hypothetical protein